MAKDFVLAKEICQIENWRLMLYEVPFCKSFEREKQAII